MLVTWSGRIDRTPSRGARQHKVRIIPQRPASAIEGLFFVVIIRYDERYQHPERDH